jgi:iron(III) transport system substrate-binding protein
MRVYAESRAVAARPEFSKPIRNLPDNLAGMLMANDFAWAARNRERILAEWNKRYDNKADPRK